MKTIEFLADAIDLMKANGTPAYIKVGTFEIESSGDLHFWAGRKGTFDNYALSFQIEFRPDHIQHLIDMHVVIDFGTVARSISINSPYFIKGRDAIKAGRYYQRVGGVAENWLTASVKCDIDSLLKLNAVCRDNHLHHVSIHNDTRTGWGKGHYAVENPKPSVFYKKVRQNIAAKSKRFEALLPVEKLALSTR